MCTIGAVVEWSWETVDGGRDGGDILRRSSRVQETELILVGIHAEPFSQDDWDLGFHGAIRGSQLGPYDQRSVHRGSQPVDVGVVEERSTLPCDGELVDVRAALLDGALRDVCGPVRVVRPELSDSVPVSHPTPTN